MCSVSWLVDSDGYQVFFNRDEQKSRALALPPARLSINDTEVLMPIDPVGQGSWISLNEFGMTLCLLNNYQGQVPEGKLISRGQLLKTLSCEAGVKQVKRTFVALDLQHYAPFTLLAFDPSLSASCSEVMAFSWDGRHCTIAPTDSPLFSSGVDLENVLNYRNGLYQALTQADKSFAQLLQFHTSHHPEHTHMSPCMHRDDAQTVSFTYVKVSALREENSRDQVMAYVPGSPCRSQLSAGSLKQHSYRLHRAELLAS
ncbi:NRDE family protein [Vibrio spartinae]|uniref:Transport and Golgi organization protein 2 n=1 Tax=Vibrio spartinae TaxID=1918945 RepID=A0ABX6QZM8_9VIBR|nr:NRDE family protein [Vibrio spartinae]QMV14683.1 hypothetical protein Vspart_01944 [Vibrio spartinae]